MPIWLEPGGLLATRNRPGSLIVLSLAILPSLRDSDYFHNYPGLTFWANVFRPCRGWDSGDSL